MTPLHPVRINATALMQLEALTANSRECRKKILSEAHNYLCRLSRPYDSKYPNGITIELLMSDYFIYKRKPFKDSEYGFYFLAPADGYIYIDRIIEYDAVKGIWNTLPAYR